MEPARITALLAVALGGFAMMVNFLALPMLMNKVSRLQTNMQVGMQNFKAMADQAWDEMVHIRRIYVGTRSNRDVDYDTSASSAVLYPHGFTPESSDYQQQTWDQFQYSSSSDPGSSTDGFSESPVTTTGSSGVDNQCPAGSPGPPGENGKDGLDGPPGVDGLQGQNAHEMKFEDLDMCSICPGGPRGPMGPAGPPGPLGKKGFIGEPGKDAVNGTVGPVGKAGKKGFQGLPGKPGAKGKPGKPAPGGKGKPGPKGATGPIGRAGPQGPPGNSSTSNNGSGPTGPRGDPGLNGIPGKTGQPGPLGSIGLTGGQGGYCPCPKELRLLGLASGDNATLPVVPPPTTTPVSGTTVPSLPPAPEAPPPDGTTPQPEAKQEVPAIPINFGGSAPGFGPPGSASIPSDGGGVVALPPAGGAAGAPSSQHEVGENGRMSLGDLLAAQNGAPAENNSGGLANLVNVPRI